MFNEQRTSARKVVKAKAVLTIAGMAPLQARTIDVATNGIAISTTEQLAVGLECLLNFDLYFEGKTVPIKARARAQYCIMSNGGFKVGLQFISVDLTGMTTLAKFLR